MQYSAHYHRVHSWLSWHFQKECCDHCGGNEYRLEWALIDGKEHEKKRENYMVLCSSCHKRYDMKQSTRDAISRGKMGKPAANRIGVVLDGGKVFSSISEASADTGVSISCISRNINGKIPRTRVGVFKKQLRDE